MLGLVPHKDLLDGRADELVLPVVVELLTSSVNVPAPEKISEKTDSTFVGCRCVLAPDLRETHAHVTCACGMYYTAWCRGSAWRVRDGVVARPEGR
jgi:hypothetical protein